MKLTSTYLLVCCCWMLGALGLKAQGTASSGENGGTQAKSEMPPALKSMQGSAGYDKEHQKWLDSQNQNPAQAKTQAQKDVQALKTAEWKAAPTPVKSVKSSEGSPYHQYKGISDPVEAKKAWSQDQKASGQ